MHCCKQTSMCTVMNSPNHYFCREGPPHSHSFSHNPITPHSLRYSLSSLHSLSKGIVRGWGCPSKVHDLELLVKPESGAVNPHCLLVLPVNLSISQLASQSLRQMCKSLCTRWSYLPYSPPLTTPPEGPLGQLPTLLLVPGSHAEARPSPPVPPLNGLPFHCRTQHWLIPRPVRKMNQPCRRDKMQRGKHATNKNTSSSGTKILTVYSAGERSI